MGARRNEILIAVDGSPASVWAIRTGIKLAGEMDAAVTLLHVVIPPVVGINEATLAMAENLFAEAKAAGEAILEAARRHLSPTMPARTVLREGFPAQEILSQARETGADYIVLGTRGGGRWAHFILGSVADAVIREAPCPVVSVSRDPVMPPTSHAGVAQSEQRPIATA